MSAFDLEARAAFDDILAKLRAEIDAVTQRADRLSHIRATIYVNALRAGASTDEANAMADGTSEKPFAAFMAEYVQGCESKAIASARADGVREGLEMAAGVVDWSQGLVTEQADDADPDPANVERAMLYRIARVLDNASAAIRALATQEPSHET